MKNIKLYQNDCLKVLDELYNQNIKIDMLLTDPPYGINFKSGHRKIKYNKIINDNNLEWLNDFVKKIYKITNNNTAHYVFCSYHNIDIFKQAFEKYFKIKNILIWEKNNTSMGDLKGDFAPKVEFILFFQKGRKLINGKRDANIFKFKKTGNKNHPTEKPVNLLEYLIEKFSNKNDLVIDPFMGSGSTGIASINTNRKFIGIELDKQYFNIAKNRIVL